MAKSTKNCPACGESVAVVDGQLAVHDRTPDPINDQAQDPERCRWSNEPVSLIVEG